MQGKIMKGIAGFYYVDVVESGIYECKAKGAFRNEHVKPLVGDNVIIEVSDEDEKIATIVEILPRSMDLIRPAVANVDQVLLIFALKSPKPHLRLLDSFLVMLEEKEIPVILLFNKEDLVSDVTIKQLKEIYEPCGYPIHFASVKDDTNLGDLRRELKGKTTALAGPSGVGKSSLMNLLFPEADMETGEISRKISRGKHTTRHTEVFRIDEDTFILDTPGFSSLRIEDIEPEELRFYFKEFRQYEGECKFQGCVHIGEPKCKVKEVVAWSEKDVENERAIGKIHKSRYDNYVAIYEELSSRKKY
jgi:ribosome biogenesis GTPase